MPLQRNWSHVASKCWHQIEDRALTVAGFARIQSFKASLNSCESSYRSIPFAFCQAPLASVQKRALMLAQPFESVFAADHGKLNVTADDVWVRSQR